LKQSNCWKSLAIDALPKADAANTDVQDSRKMAEKPQTKDALNAENWHVQGQKQFRLKDYAKALYAFDQALKRNPRHGEAYFRRGVCRYKLKHYRSAQSDFEAAALMGCETAQLWSKFDRMSPEEEEN
jgi:tetratricopeptide (TPR) repeat protein